MINKLLVIEPHPDDTILSAHYLLKGMRDLGTYDISIGSVGSFPETIRSTKAYCDKMGYKHELDNFTTDMDYKKHRTNIYELKKVDHPFDHQVNEYLYKFQEQLQAVQLRVEELLLYSQPDIVWTVLGIVHPMHVLVRIAVDRLFPGKVFYYADTPYQCRKYGQVIIEDSGLTKVHEVVPLKETAESKVKLFMECYPSEKAMMRFDRPLYDEFSEKLYGHKDKS